MPNLTSVGITAGIPTSGTGTVSTIDQLLAKILDGTQQAKITDGSTVAGVKAASTAPVATDPALVVAISPNSVNANGSAISSASAPVVIASDQAAVQIKQQKPTTGTQSSVASSASDVTILASNANRLGAAVFNDSTALLYLLVGSGTSSATVHTVQILAGGYYEVPSWYTGVLKGLWASATGSARVTEFA